MFMAELVDDGPDILQRLLGNKAIVESNGQGFEAIVPAYERKNIRAVFPSAVGYDGIMTAAAPASADKRFEFRSIPFFLMSRSSPPLKFRQYWQTPSASKIIPGKDSGKTQRRQIFIGLAAGRLQAGRHLSQGVGDPCFGGEIPESPLHPILRQAQNPTDFRGAILFSQA